MATITVSKIKPKWIRRATILVLFLPIWFICIFLRMISETIDLITDMMEVW